MHGPGCPGGKSKAHSLNNDPTLTSAVNRVETVLKKCLIVFTKCLIVFHPVYLTIKKERN